MANACSRARIFLFLERGTWALALGVVSQVVACTEPTFVDDRAAGEGAESDAASAVTQERDATTSDSIPQEAGEPDDEDVDGALPLADGGPAEGNTPAFDGGAQTGDDASTLPVMTSDASTSEGIPSWALPLIGTYAKRSVTFSWDDQPTGTPYNTQNVELSILKITQNGNDLDLSVQLCDYRVSLNTPDAPLFFVNAPATPPMKGRIELLGAPNTFSSTEMLQHLGFDPAPERSTCSGGRRTKFAGQDWISGTTCRCVGLQLPVSLDDCRVIDGDGDGRGGITGRGPFFSTPIADYVVVFDYAVTLFDGHVAADGKHTLREKRAQAVSCINAAVDSCDVGHNTLCPGGTTKLIKHTGSSPLTCASLNAGDFGPVDGWPANVDCRAK